MFKHCRGRRVADGESRTTIRYRNCSGEPSKAKFIPAGLKLLQQAAAVARLCGVMGEICACSRGHEGHAMIARQLLFTPTALVQVVVAGSGMLQA